MRITLTSPFGPPEVRRGAERYCEELAEWLALRGHTVRWIYTGDSPVDPTGNETFRRTVVRRGKPFRVGRLHVDELLRSAAPVARSMRRDDAQVVQSHHFADAIGVRAGRRGRVPYVLWLPGVPRRASLGGRPLHRALFRSAAAGAARIHALSDFARDALAAEFGLEAEVVPPGVNTAAYDGASHSPPEPVIVCTAAADDPRKRVGLLVEAFDLLVDERPDARLILAPPNPAASEPLLSTLSPKARARAEVRSVVGIAALAELYRSATVTALPSVDEAFGLVIVESLAAGTPVVATRDGAIPEILDDPMVGRLFERDDPHDLAERLIEVIDLAQKATTPGRCQQHARRWDWDTVGPKIESSFLELVG